MPAETPLCVNVLKKRKKQHSRGHSLSYLRTYIMHSTLVYNWMVDKTDHIYQRKNEKPNRGNFENVWKIHPFSKLTTDDD